LSKDEKDIFEKLKSFSGALISGRTGSGKSYLLHKLIKYFTENYKSGELKLVLIDPKRVEYSEYKDSSYLFCPVIYTVPEAKEVFKTIGKEIDKRKNTKEKMPQIAIIIDELSDLTRSGFLEFFEEKMSKAATEGKAFGIKIFMATSCPSPEDVFTEKIKNSFPIQTVL